MNNKTHANTTIYLIATIIIILIGLVTIGLGILSAIMAVASGNLRNGEAPMVAAASLLGSLLWFFVLSAIPLMVLSVLQLIEIYQMWAAIDDGQTRMTGGKALGFLFIPLFSLYWIFQVWGGFPTDYNAYVNRYNLQSKVPVLESPLYTAIPILAILSGFLIPLPFLLIAVYMVMRKNNEAIDLLKNAIGDSRNQVAGNIFQNAAFQKQN